jgi:hypothetical protein
MPSPPQWFQWVDDALEALRAFPGPLVDRASLETLLRVSRRTAIRLMNGFGGYQAGKTFLIDREDLIAALERVQTGETFSHEVRRRIRLADDLERTRRDWRARQVKLPVAAEPRQAASLPAGMRIVRAGVLEVEFSSGGELLGRLYELVRMAGEDFETFETLLGGTEPGL